MKRAAILLAIVSLSIVGVLFASPPEAKPPAGLIRSVGNAGCSDATLLQRPGWTTSGAWTADGNGLLLADALNRTILTYSSTGRPFGPLTGPIGSAVANLFPSRLKSDGTTHQLLLEIQGGQDGNKVVTLDGNFVPSAAQAVESLAFKSDTRRISGLFQWEPVGSDLVTFSDIQGPKENDWDSGIVRFPLGDPVHFTELRSVGRRDNERTFYRLGYQYITSLGQTAYVLTMGNTPMIYKDGDGAKASTLLRVGTPFLDPTSNKGQNELNPDLPTFRTSQDFVTVMATVERSSMATGIYGWQGHLYVVSRFPDGDQTGWLLRKFAPDGSLVGVARIPSQASHLTPVPGPRMWAFVEKGPVKGYGVQDIKTILFVPSSLLGRLPPPPSSAKMTDAPSICR